MSISIVAIIALLTINFALMARACLGDGVLTVHLPTSLMYWALFTFFLWTGGAWSALTWGGVFMVVYIVLSVLAAFDSEGGSVEAGLGAFILGVALIITQIIAIHSTGFFG